MFRRRHKLIDDKIYLLVVAGYRFCRDTQQLSLISQLCGPITPEVWPGVENLELFNRIELAKNHKRQVRLIYICYIDKQKLQIIKNSIQNNGHNQKTMHIVHYTLFACLSFSVKKPLYISNLYKSKLFRNAHRSSIVWGPF